MGRVILGGLLAGLVINVVCGVNYGLIIGKRIMEAQQHGHFLQQPRFPFQLAGLLMGVPDNLANAAWGLSGRYLPTMWMIEHVVACMLGTLVGAWLYREQG